MLTVCYVDNLKGMQAFIFFRGLVQEVLMNIQGYFFFHTSPLKLKLKDFNEYPQLVFMVEKIILELSSNTPQ